MLPLYLTIEGIYSYQERQHIDFTSLTSAGLFGIFGAVGAGKSSILEAITYALYGETERLNKADKRGYNMMNLKSNHIYIEFEFLNFENRQLRVVREFKRNSKKFEDVKTPTIQFYEKNMDKWIPLEQATPQELIGLSYHNFKRTIIIPQGQFKEFLELGAKDRNEMMKEIFNLQKFDLSDNISKLKKENEEKLSFKEGELKGYEEIHEEAIQIQKDKLKEETDKQKSLEVILDQLKTHYEHLKSLKSDFELLERKRKEFSLLHSQKYSFDELEEKVNRYEKIEKLFKNLLDNRTHLTKELQFYTNKRVTEVEALNQVQNKLTHISDNIEALQESYEKLPDAKQMEEDLQQLLAIFPLQERLTKEKSRTIEGTKKIAEEEKNLKDKKDYNNTIESEIESLKKQRIDSQLLLEVGNWYEKELLLSENQNKQQQKIKDTTAQLQEIVKELSCFVLFKDGFVPNYKEKITIEKESIEKEKDTLQQKLNQLELQRQLSHYTKELHEGSPCPLCGSTEHPSITHFEDVSTELTTTQKAIKALDTKQEQLQQSLFQIEKTVDKKQFFENQLQSEKETAQQIEKERLAHHEKFIWGEFSKEDRTAFDEKRQFAATLAQQIETKESLRKKVSKEMEELQIKIEKYKKGLENIYKEIATLEGNIASRKESLKKYSFSDYENKDFALIEKEYQFIARSNKYIEQTYTDLTQERNRLNPLQSQYETQLKNTNELLEKWEAEYQTIEKTLTDTLIQEKIPLKEVTKILDSPLPIEENRVKIQDFKVRYKVLCEQIKELESKFANVSFDPKAFAEIEAQYILKEQEVKANHENCIRISSELERISQALIIKKELMKSAAYLRKRNENIKLLEILFRGKGFVEYISSIYLQQLCQHANERFHRMTRGQLSLQIGENNEFEIIDYLNEGKSRSVKTLSGGQAFQVSLSLALALAESVQSEASADKNFFFIDEGFGTQDTESVNIVFETMANLLKDNRIVGIISHVEELKERIPISLTITNDPERGSIISS